jgi:aspartyl aminopeptidase
MKLCYERKDIYNNVDEEEILNAKKYSKKYMEFLDKARTEYLCAAECLKMLKDAGFKDITECEKLNVGDKVYFVNKEKSIFASVIGKDDLKNGVNIVGSHIDSPRLDLKPMPLIENQNMALFKTQFYGGIKKYQWLSIPLEMHGVVYTEDNEKVEISVGGEDDDFCFTIADLLPHLAKDQLSKNATEFIDAEKMSVLVGNIKDEKAKKNKVKENILKILNEKYGIKEIDFVRSDISFVPAFKTRYIGFDKSMIGGYGHDDRVCSYANVKAIIDAASENKKLNKTAICLLVDKEEIGSVGNTSMSTQAFDLFSKMIISKTGNKELSELEMYYNSKMLSADVTAAVDPDYEEVSDVLNGNVIGCGVAIEKYTGGSGKYSASEATAKFTSEVTQIFDKNDVIYQFGVLGKQGKGGGGTIAYILANKGIDVIDCGTPVLAMHSPFEVVSVYDTYMTYLAYKTFFNS